MPYELGGDEFGINVPVRGKTAQLLAGMLPIDVEVLVSYEGELTDEIDPRILYEGLYFGRNGKLLGKDEMEKIEPKVVHAAELWEGHYRMCDNPELARMLVRASRTAFNDFMAGGDEE
jgi:hypothetical protein